jgi:hypothetical protein
MRASRRAVRQARGARPARRTPWPGWPGASPDDPTRAGAARAGDTIAAARERAGKEAR